MTFLLARHSGQWLIRLTRCENCAKADGEGFRAIYCSTSSRRSDRELRHSKARVNAWGNHMSLTSLLKGNADVRLRFRTEFPKPKFHFDKAKPLLVEPRSNRFSLMGTAFDYVLRFQVQRLNPKKAKTSPWVAALAADESDKRFRAKASNIIKMAEDRLKRL